MNRTGKLATTPASLDEVFQLRYRYYHAKGAIAAWTDQRFRHHYGRT